MTSPQMPRQALRRRIEWALERSTSPSVVDGAPEPVRRAAVIAQVAHDGQSYGQQGPYFDAHVAAVYRRALADNADESMQIAALLHDVVEDTELHLQDLAELGVTQDALEMIALLTKVPGEPNEHYYARLAAHPRARRVKLADVAVNADPDNLARLADPARRARLQAKYARARQALGAPPA